MDMLKGQIATNLLESCLKGVCVTQTAHKYHSHIYLGFIIKQHHLFMSSISHMQPISFSLDSSWQSTVSIQTAQTVSPLSLAETLCNI